MMELIRDLGEKQNSESVELGEEVFPPDVDEERFQQGDRTYWLG